MTGRNEGERLVIAREARPWQSADGSCGLRDEGRYDLMKEAPAFVLSHHFTFLRRIATAIFMASPKMSSQ